MSKFKFNLTNIFFWVGVILSILLFENIDFFNKVNGQYLPLDDSNFYIIFSIATLCYLAMFVYDIIFNRHRVNVPVIVILLLFTGSMIASTWLFEGMSFSSGAPDYYLSFNDKIRQTLITISFGLTLISLFTVYITNHASSRRLKFVYVLIMLVCYVLVISSLITEFDKYYSIANGIAPYNTFIGSLFYNSNMFAVILLLGIAASIGLNCYKKNLLSYLSIIFFAVIQVFVRSLTCIIISFSLVTIYLIIEIAFNFKKKFSLAMTELTIFVTVVTTVVVVVVVCSSNYVGNFSNFCRYLIDEIFTSKYDTFSDRTTLWAQSISLIFKDIKSMIVGYGFLNSEIILGHTHYVPIVSEKMVISCHDGYLQILLNFGFSGIILLAAFMAWYIVSIVRIFKTNKRFCFIFLALAIAYLSLGVTESIIAFDADAQGLLIGVFIFMPVIIKCYHEKKPAIGDALIKEETPALLSPALMVRQASRIFLGVISALAIMLVFPEILNDNANKYLFINILTTLGFLFFFVPYLNGLWAKNATVNRYLARMLINSLIMLLVAGAMVTVYIFYYEVYPDIKWFVPGAIGVVLFIQLLIYSIACKPSIKLFLNTFVGLKTSLGGLIFVGGMIAAAYYIKGVYLPYNVYTQIGLPILTLVVFFTFSICIPFKDLRKILIYESSFSINELKREVIRERLEVSL